MYFSLSRPLVYEGTIIPFSTAVCTASLKTVKNSFFSVQGYIFAFPDLYNLRGSFSFDWQGNIKIVWTLCKQFRMCLYFCPSRPLPLEGIKNKRNFASNLVKSVLFLLQICREQNPFNKKNDRRFYIENRKNQNRQRKRSAENGPAGSEISGGRISPAGVLYRQSRKEHSIPPRVPGSTTWGSWTTRFTWNSTMPSMSA